MLKFFDTTNTIEDAKHCNVSLVMNSQDGVPIVYCSVCGMRCRDVLGYGWQVDNLGIKWSKRIQARDKKSLDMP